MRLLYFVFSVFAVLISLHLSYPRRIISALNSSSPHDNRRRNASSKNLLPVKSNATATNANSRKASRWSEQLRLKALIPLVKNLQVRLDRFSSMKSRSSKNSNQYWKSKLWRDMLNLQSSLNRTGKFLGRYNKIQSEKTERQKMSKRIRRKYRNSSRTKAMSSSIKMDRIYKKKLNMDVVGEPGYQCKTHRDCKPGLCCHINAKKFLYDQTTLSKCVEHRLNRSQACSNSCQCVFGLNCYKNSSFDSETKHNLPVERIVVESAIFRSTGVCKTPVTDDVLHGKYLNSDKSSFRLTDDK